MTELAGKRILVTGGAGFVGSIVVAELKKHGAGEITSPRSAEFDLRKQDDCARLFADVKPQIVIHLAASVGGIGANRENPGKYFYDNMAMGLNVIEASRLSKVEKIVVSGTICSYPKLTPVPFREEELWNGYPEETNAPYGIAKKALFIMLEGYRAQYGLDFTYVMPVNLYGPGDNFNPQSSHVIPALVRKYVEARKRGEKRIVAWGTGAATREFLHVRDCARGLVAATVAENVHVPVNLGAGMEISIRDLTFLIKKLTRFEGAIEWDSTKPDGQPRRSLDTSRAKSLFGWQAEIPFEEGLIETIEWFERNNP